MRSRLRQRRTPLRLRRLLLEGRRRPAGDAGGDHHPVPVLPRVHLGHRAGADPRSLPVPEALGFANGSFFLALLLPQILVGVLFDRIGPRITVSALSVLMVAGRASACAGRDRCRAGRARFVVGLGCAGSFMSAVVLISRWYPRQSWSMALSWVFALSQIGFLLAGLPLAVASRVDRLARRRSSAWLSSPR